MCKDAYCERVYGYMNSRKTFEIITKDILGSLHIYNPVLLGQGSESQVYGYTNDAVVRIYKSDVSIESLNELNTIYTFLSSHNLPFDIPRLYEICHIDDVVFQIEKRLVGTSPALVYEKLKERQRQRLLLNFLEAVDSFKSITLDERDYGRLMKDVEDTTHYTNWPQFIKEKAPLKLHGTKAVLQEDGIDVDYVVEKFHQDVHALSRRPRKNFVHGDYFFGNVLVNDKLEISAVLDVSWWSAVGDHNMDIAGAVMFLDLYDFVSPQDHAFITSQAIRRHGEDILTYIRIYEIYYSLLLSDCKTLDPPAYAWSLRNLRRYMLS